MRIFPHFHRAKTLDVVNVKEELKPKIDFSPFEQIGIVEQL